MSGVVRLPPELLDFLGLPGPQTLLVRGPPGSGKTTLSLALLEAFRGSRILVTSRVPGRELHREFSWLGANGGASIQVVDTSEMEESIHDAARVMAKTREVLLAPLDPGGRDTSQFLWLPPPVQEAWSRLRTDAPSLIIVDSWDALIESFLGGPGEPDRPVPDRAFVERLLIRRMSRAPAHLVFVLEREEQTALDYLVNGVVVTRREAIDDRLSRWMTILKLRGVRIANAVYPFSLEGGRFESILPVRPYAALRSGPPDPEPDLLAGHVWPGSRPFAENFGRLAFGKITLLEIDDQVSSRVGDLLTTPLMAHVLTRGGRVLLVPHSSDTPEDVYSAVHPAVSEGQFLDGLRMIIPPGPVPAGKEKLWRVVIPALRSDTPGSSESSESAAIRFLREGASERSPSLLVVSLQGLAAVARANGIAVTDAVSAQLPEAFVGTIRGQPVHSVIIGPHDSPILDPLRSIASVRIVVSVRQGRIFLHGIAPWTPNLVLAEGPEGTAYQLLRVV
jgi:KaiC/GvpD/RAD55 family RecA-like ATPase